MSERTRYQELEQSRGSLIANAAHAGNELLDGDLDLSGWRASLDRDAREVMANLEQKIYNYARDLYADRPYRPPIREGVDNKLPPENETFTATTGGGWQGSSVAAGGGWSGAWAPPSGLPVPGGGPNQAGDPVGGSGPGDTVLDGVLPGANGTVTGPQAGGPPSSGAFADTPWGRVLAPGGVIGSPAASAFGVGTAPGGPAVGGPAAAGLVPGTGSATRPAGGPGVVPFVPPMMPGRPGSGATSATGGRRSRSGLPSVFDTPDGPPGVIQPPAEPADHDPGPGVIGIDR